MSNWMYIFPYERINRNSKIILYGAGKVGQCYWQQIEKTKYCKILCMVDRDCGRYFFSGKISIYKNIPEVDYDYLVIAVENPLIAEKIKIELINKNIVPQKKIIVSSGRRFMPIYIDKSLPNGDFEIQEEVYAYNKAEMAFAIFLPGGLGDCIIAKRLVEDFVKHVKGTCLVDFYTEATHMEYVKTLFEGEKYFNAIFCGRNGGEFNYKRECKNYIFSINIGYILSIDQFDLEKMQRNEPVIAGLLNDLRQNVISYGLQSKFPNDNNIHFSRCKFLNKNCYTAYEYDTFDLSNKQINIPFNNKYENQYYAIGLKRYITLNYGWGTNKFGKIKIPNKIWPLTYYQSFVALFKQKFPEIELVQLGMCDSEKIEGIDHYIFGHSIELSKYILKGALLHIDGEGGLVHLATQLGTKCVVMFGPTPVHYFGYENNINIVSEKCNNCYYLDPDFSKCIRNMEEPECMYSILPECVMKKVKEYFINEMME